MASVINKYILRLEVSMSGSSVSEHARVVQLGWVPPDVQKKVYIENNESEEVSDFRGGRAVSI